MYAALRERLRDDDVVTVKASIPAGLARIAAALREGRDALPPERGPTSHAAGRAQTRADADD